MEETDIPICRICMDGEQPSDLISPCDCRGSMSFVHRHCLDQWYAMRRNESCDTCYCKYAKKWCGMKPISEWWKLPPLSLYRLQLLVFFEQPLRASRLFVVSLLTSLYYPV
uniref:RING-CH-type domain-containing protein n=1 Tax=Acrobeloides nanus TaxID=290746 RepID=A0A914CJA0_9BILA